MRITSRWGIPTALIAGITLAVPLTTTAAQTALGSSPAKIAAKPADAVTLPTGDLVRLTTRSGKPVVLTQPAAASGPGRLLVKHQVGKDVYVMPADAEPYVGRFLDPGLFDVTRLRTALKPGGRIPVRISYQGSVPAVAGVTIISASSGVASGYLTPASSRAFGRALTAQWVSDTKAGWQQRTTLFGGVTRITADVPGPVVVTPHFPMVTLNLAAISANGKPQPDGLILLMNVDDGAKYADYTEVVDGIARVSVPKGNYTAIGDDYTEDDAGNGTDRVASISDFQVTGAGQTVTLDYRKATVGASVKLPQKASLYSYFLDWNRADAQQQYLLDSGYFSDGTTAVLMAPSKPATVGSMNVVQSWALAGPGPDPAYTFDLAALAPSIPTVAKYTFTAADLATVHSAYYDDGSSSLGGFLRTAAFPASSIWGAYWPISLGRTRVEYVAATGGTPDWIEGAVFNDSAFDDPGLMDQFIARTYVPGTTYKDSWFRGPLGAGIPKQAAGGYCYACRTATDLEIFFDGFTDATSDHSGELYGAQDGLPVSRFRFYQNGTLVSDQDDQLGGDFTVPTGKTTYEAVLDVDRRLQQPNQSTSSRTDVTFQSSSGSGGRLPASWFCGPGDSSSCRTLPILQAKLSLPTSLNGTLPAAGSTVTVTAARTQYTPDAGVTSATLEVRPAGWEWIPVPLTSIGGGKYQGTIDNSAFAGSNVDVRVSAADSGGSTFQQTVLRAYTVAGS